MSRRKKWLDQYKDYQPPPRLLHPDAARFDNATLFTAENDHNPIVAKRCPDCRGAGKWGEYIGKAHVLRGCVTCNATGKIDEPTLRFTNNEPPVTVKPNANGWVLCPHCGKRFHPPDPNVWTGWRHQCGQRIHIQG
jgi:hypothetical protein